MSDQSSAAENHEQEPRSFLGVIVHSFFIIPFLIVVFCLLLFTAIHLLTSENQTAYDYLENVKVGGLSKRWQAAFELSKLLAHPKQVPHEQRFVNEMLTAFKQSEHDDPRVRQYLALAMGRMGSPEFFEALSANIKSEKEENLYAIIYALGMLKDKRAIAALEPFLKHEQARIRSCTVVALGSIGTDPVKELLKRSLTDSEPNVQWGSAISLAQLGDNSGRDVLAQLLDRDYLAKFSEVDPLELNQLMIAAIEAIQHVQDQDLQRRVQELGVSDPNMKVRAAALESVKR